MITAIHTSHTALVKFNHLVTNPLRASTSVTHKGLRLFFEKGNGSKLPTVYLAKIALILDALDALASENDIKALGDGIRLLTGNYRFPVYIGQPKLPDNLSPQQW